MTTLVYKFHCEPPTVGAELLRAQIVAAHHYRNEHVAIERGRRAAIRSRLEQLPSVSSALVALKSATRSGRREAREGLTAALRAGLALPPSQRALCRLIEETLSSLPLDALPHHVAIARIERLAAELRRGARALTQAHWGTYLTVEASADQVRKDIPLYEMTGRTACEPTDPRFRRMQRGRIDGQAGIHVQNRVLTIGGMLACKDQWARLELTSERDDDVAARARSRGAPWKARGVDDRSRRGRTRHGYLHLRVGSDGHAPVWGVLPIKVDRAIPDASHVKWVRVSCRQDGPWERWTCEITVELPPGYRKPREMAKDRRGAIALVVEWVEEDGRVRVGRWADDEGQEGSIWLDERCVKGLRKPEGIRSIRDVYLNAMRGKLVPVLRSHVHHHPDAPGWLKDAAQNGYAWRSPSRFHDLARRWRREKYDGARDAYEILEDWEFGGYHRRGAKRPRRGEWGGDAHLYEYECGARGDALAARKDLYRTTAAAWATRYRVVILEKRNLSFEARRPDEPGVSEQSWRQLAGVYELVGAARNAFGPAGVWEAPRRPTDAVDEEGDPLPEPGAESLVERWRDAGAPVPEVGEKPASAWSRRKAAKRARSLDEQQQQTAALERTGE